MAYCASDEILATPLGPEDECYSVASSLLEELEAFEELRESEEEVAYAEEPERAAFEEDPPEVLTFEKIEVVRAKHEEVESALKAALEAPQPQEDEEEEENEEDGEPLTAYLPNRFPVQVRIRPECSVGEAIERVLRKVAGLIAQGERVGRGAEALGHGKLAADCYEFRLHDVDGEPDEDCPALERERPALSFGADEVCLVEAPNAPREKPDDRDLSALAAVYLPDGTRVSVAGDGTAGVTIERALRAVGGRFGRGKVAAECYELRLHDADGKPDDDFPALERDKLVASVGADAYCVVLRPGKQPPPPRSSSVSVRPTGESSIASSQYLRPSGLSRVCINVVCPDDDVVRVETAPSWTVAEILPRVLRRKGIHRWAIDFHLRMREADRDRLCLPYLQLCEHLTVTDLVLAKLDTIELYCRQYACGGWFIDAPAVEKPEALLRDIRDDASDPRRTERRNISPGDFQFNPATGPAYKEWNVIKINDLGRKQERVLGIDGTKLYNTKRDDAKRNKVISATFRPSRKILDILRTAILDSDPDRKTIQIVYVEQGKQVARTYELETARDAAHVVAKIRYNRRLLKDQNPSRFAKAAAAAAAAGK